MKLKLRALLSMALAVAAFSRPGHPEVPIVAGADALASSLRAQFSQVQSVHLRARYSLAFGGEDFAPVVRYVTLEYWASGDRFRIESLADPELAKEGFIGNQTITFDGNESRLLTNGNNTLIIKTGEIPDSSIVPNPLFVPLAFLNVESRACDDCRPSLSDVRQMTASRLPPPTRVQVAALAGQSPGAQVTIFGNSPQDSLKQVRLLQRGASWTPVASEIRAADGSLLERNTFESLEAIPNTSPQLYIPRHLILENWSDGTESPNGASSLRIDVSIEELSINGLIDDAIFSIPESSASTVIDEDAHQVLRAPLCSKAAERPHG